MDSATKTEAKCKRCGRYVAVPKIGVDVFGELSVVCDLCDGGGKGHVFEIESRLPKEPTLAPVDG